MLLDRRGNRLLLVGNECMGYLPEAELGLRVELFQEFSLMGQPREKSRPLRKILAGFGVGRGSRVGCAGWKCYQSRLVRTTSRAARGESAAAEATLATDLPAYIVDVLRKLAGPAGQVRNATGIFMNPDDGLRLTSEPEQIAQFEFAATVSSEGVLGVLRGIRPGVAEDDLERLLDSRGLPLSCHRIVGFGEKAKRGLASPSARRAALGDSYTVSFGVTGSLTCRAGCVARGPDDLPGALRDFYPRYAANYFSVVAAWYTAIGVGATADEVSRRPRPAAIPASSTSPSIRDTTSISTSGSTRLSPPAAGRCSDREWPCKWTSFRFPAARSVASTPRTEWRWPTRRSAAGFRNATRIVGNGSDAAGRSCKRRSASGSIPPCCRWGTSPAGCRRMSSRRSRRSWSGLNSRLSSRGA